MPYYAGIGSRETPPKILAEMTKIAIELEKRGWVLRSGGAAGADSAFESGVSSPRMKEIYLPWPGFNGNSSPLHSTPAWAEEIAAEFHPRYHSLSQGAQKLMARNSKQIFGNDSLAHRTKVVICWTPGGATTGGTGQAIRIATHYGIPIINMGLVIYSDAKAVLAAIDKLQA